MANKFYVHNDIFRYEDEVFGDSEAELDEGEIIIQILTVRLKQYRTQIRTVIHTLSNTD